MQRTQVWFSACMPGGCQLPVTPAPWGCKPAGLLKHHYLVHKPTRRYTQTYSFSEGFLSHGSSSARLLFTHLATRSLYHITAYFSYLVCVLVCMGMQNSFVKAREQSQIDILMFFLVCDRQDLLFVAASTSLDNTWVSWVLFVSTCHHPVQMLYYRCVDLPLAFHSFWRLTLYSKCFSLWTPALKGCY